MDSRLGLSRIRCLFLRCLFLRQAAVRLCEDIVRQYGTTVNSLRTYLCADSATERDWGLLSTQFSVSF